MSIEIRDLHFSFGDQEILRGIDFSAPDGTATAVLGPNGVGKSTLFRCMLGFLSPTKGQVLINGREIRQMDRRSASREIAYIPQSCVPAFNYSLLEVVMMGLNNRLGLLETPRKEHVDAAMEALETLGIARLAHRSCGKVSGGERQLALLARALVQRARVLIMDEPTANLDCGNAYRVMDRICRLSAEGYTVVFSTHDPNQAFRHAHGVLALRNGAVMAAGDPGSVLTGEVLSDLYGVPMAVCSVSVGGDRFPVSVTAG